MPEYKSAEEQHGQCDSARYVLRRTDVSDHEKGQHDRKRRDDHDQKYAETGEQVVALQP